MTPEEEAKAAFDEAWRDGIVNAEYRIEAANVWCEGWLSAREATAKKCRNIAKTLTLQIGDGPVIRANSDWVADEIEHQFGIKP